MINACSSLIYERLKFIVHNHTVVLKWRLTSQHQRKLRTFRIRPQESHLQDKRKPTPLNHILVLADFPSSRKKNRIIRSTYSVCVCPISTLEPFDWFSLNLIWSLCQWMSRQRRDFLKSAITSRSDTSARYSPPPPSVSWSGTVGRTPRTGDQVPVHKHRKTHTHSQTPNIHALSGIRNHGPGFRASEDSTRPRPLGYRDRRQFLWFWNNIRW
jgi:hypothetical protein